MTKTKTSLIASSTRTLVDSLLKHPAHAYLFYSSNGKTPTTPAINYFSSKLVSKFLIDANNIVLIDGKESGIDDIRELKKITSFKNQVNVIKKLVVISNFEKLSIESKNALLKSLEEPVSGLIYILGCTSLKDIPDTIKSRSRLVSLLPPIADDYIDKYPEKSKKEVDLAIKLGRGDSQKVTDYLDGYNETLEKAKEIMSIPKYDRYKLSSSLSENRTDAIVVVEYIQSILLHLLETKIADNKKSVTDKTISNLKYCENILKSLNANGNIKLNLDSLFNKL